MKHRAGIYPSLNPATVIEFMETVGGIGLKDLTQDVNNPFVLRVVTKGDGIFTDEIFHYQLHDGAGGYHTSPAPLEEDEEFEPFVPTTEWLEDYKIVLKEREHV